MSWIKAIIQAIFGFERPMSSVDVAKILDDMAAQRSDKLNWRESIVDLLKLLDLDSSFASRAQLAAELGDEGGYTGTAEENVALHREVMWKLAENGGKVPPELM